METMAQEATESTSDQVTGPIQSVLDIIQSSVANIILTAGILFFTGGIALELIPQSFFLFESFPNQFVEKPIWAAIFGLWGIGLLLLGTVLRIVFWWGHR